MRADSANLVLEIVLLLAFFAGLPFILLGVATTWALVAQGVFEAGSPTPNSPGDWSYLMIYLELTIPLVGLVLLGWGLRRILRGGREPESRA